MPRKRLTQPTVDRISAPTDKPQVDYFDTILPSFGLRVGRKRKSFFVMVRALRAGEWKLQRVTLGTTVELTVSDAREQAKAAIERAAKGEAPTEIKVERKAAMADESRNTFGTVLATFMVRYRTRKKAKLAPRTQAEMQRVLGSDLFAGWRERPIAKITRDDVEAVLDVLVERKAEIMANRTLAYLSMVFGWALNRGTITSDPTDRIDLPGVEPEDRDRVLSPDEIRAIWAATASTQAGKADVFGSIVKILMLTGQRRNEVAGMRWSEIDMDTHTWTLPPERTKNRRKHIVPLSRAVLGILGERRDEQAARRHEAEHAARLAGLDSPPDLVFTSNWITPFSGWSRSKARLDGRANIEPWTLHDLRRTFVTSLNEDLSILPHVVEVAVNHAGSFRAGAAKKYNHAIYLKERRAAMDAWDAEVLKIVGEIEAPANVVSMFSTKRNT
ncbi:putative Phage integrase [Thiocapsa sp. KS1]|nr:site-specific integrase [Thiocapsa sp. KS1]CRI68163.1 putative Phage integrase [Thiocapsa sp. KS1]